MQAETKRWENADGIVIAAPDLARRDRLIVAGEPAALLPAAFEAVGPGFAVVGDEAVVGTLPGVEQSGRFLWMDTTSPSRGEERGVWLDSDAGVAEFLAEASPGAFAQPGGTGVRRWAGIRDERGGLIATAAEAWPAPGLGFIGGVATHPAWRGRGLALALCRFVTNDLLRGAERVGLLADHANEAAKRTYLRLGYTLRPLGAARMVGQG
jgi:ribosomal protein S18 acetylase RimI-like enzyme